MRWVFRIILCLAGWAVTASMNTRVTAAPKSANCVALTRPPTQPNAIGEVTGELFDQAQMPTDSSGQFASLADESRHDSSPRLLTGAAPVVLPYRAREVSRLADILKREKQVFPSNLSSPFTPAGFEKALGDSIDKCGLHMRPLAVDCDEYPCIAWVDSREIRLDMGACPTWNSAFGEQVAVRPEVIDFPDGGYAVLAAMMPVPDDELQAQVALARYEQRCADKRGQLEAQIQPVR